MTFPHETQCPCGSGKALGLCCGAGAELEDGEFESWLAQFEILDKKGLKRALGRGKPDFEVSGMGQWTWLRPEGGQRQERALLCVSEDLLVAAAPSEELAEEVRILLESRAGDAISHVGTARWNVDENLVPTATRYPHVANDLREYLDGDDLSIRVPREERTIGLYLGRIAAAVSAARPGAIVDTGVPCRRRPGNRPCKSDVTGQLDDAERIHWNCPRCGDSGTISDWLGTPFDSVARRAIVRVEDLTPTTYTLRLRTVEHKRLLRLPHLTGPALRILAGAMVLPAGFVRISGSRTEFVAAARCIVFQFAEEPNLTKADVDALTTLHSTFALHGGGRPDLSPAAQCAEVLLFERSRRLTRLPDSDQIGGTHRLRVGLLNVDPPVWRSLELPSRYTLEDLHEALILAFGWSNAHAHAFAPRGSRKVEDERNTLLSDILPHPGDSVVWEYDLGDSWRHEVLVEEILSGPSGDPEGPDGPDGPRLLDGERAAPPEDCGGPPGFENLRDILADPLHVEYKSTVGRVGVDYNPDAFDRAAYDERVRRMEKAWTGTGDPSRGGSPAWHPGGR